MTTFSSVFNWQPGTCSPSRRVGVKDLNFVAHSLLLTVYRSVHHGKLFHDVFAMARVFSIFFYLF